MADIRVEKKKPVWPWLLLIIILAGIIFLYFYGSTDTEDTDDTELEEIEELEDTNMTHARTLKVKYISQV